MATRKPTVHDADPEGYPLAQGEALMANRQCLTCGQPTPRTRCPDCQRQRDRDRNAQRSGLYRGDGGEHQRLRAAWVPLVATGTVLCARCGEPIGSVESFDLDHVAGGRHPSHQVCNRGAWSTDRLLAQG